MNLELIKKEIEAKKKEKRVVETTTGVGMAKDTFLHGLVESLNTGSPNIASKKLKLVTERSNKMDVTPEGGVINKNTGVVEESFNYPSNTTTQTHSVQQNNQRQSDPNAIDPREEQFYKNLQETKQILGANGAGLADAMAMYNKPQSNTNQQGFITNPNFLTEQVNVAVHNFMNENFASIVQDAMKSVIIEMYAKERVETALKENKKMIESMVIDTIIAIKKRNEQKSSK